MLIPPGRRLNRPTPEGIAAGAELARLCDIAAAEQLAQDPGAVLPERCSSCAFRLGTIPNGCLSTIGDAVKAVMERVPFWCHQHMKPDGEPTQLCSGWRLMFRPDAEPVRVPWPFSDEVVTACGPGAMVPYEPAEVFHG